MKPLCPLNLISSVIFRLHNIVDIKKMLEMYYENQRKIRDQSQQPYGTKSITQQQLLNETTEEIQMNVKEINLLNDTITTNKKSIYLE